MQVSRDHITRGRRLFAEFKAGETSGFYTALFVAIGRADKKNLYQLSLGYTGEIYAYLEHNGTLELFEWEVYGPVNEQSPEVIHFPKQ